VIRGLVRGLERRATLAEPPDWMWDAFGAAPGYAGRSMNVPAALQLAAVFSAVRITAGIASSLPMDVYRAPGEPAVGSAGSFLLTESANPEMPADQYLEVAFAHIELHGNHFAEKVRNRAGQVGELWPIDPTSVTVERDRDGRRRYRLQGEDRTFDRGTILHIPGFGVDGIKGLSPITQAREMLGIAAAREEYEGRFYGNNASAGYWIKHPGTLSKDAADRLKADIDAKHKGVGNAWRPGVLEEGMDVADMGMPLKDQQFIELQQFNATQIAHLMQVPPSWIGGRTGDSLTYTTVEGEALHYVKFMLAPKLVRVEKALAADPDIFPDPCCRPKFNVEGLLRGDSQARAQFYETLTRIGVLSPNEIREKEDMPPRAGGDTYMDPPVPAPAAPVQPAARANGNGLFDLDPSLLETH
jgi:HK97 family phage portal protein